MTRITKGFRNRRKNNRNNDLLRSTDKMNPSEEYLQQDGRNKEWQDRARVNTAFPNPDTKTNIERDFEPEQLPNEDYDRDDVIY